MWAALVAAILLAPPPDPAPAPASRIVFASARTGAAQLYSVEPSGDGLAQLTFGAGNWGFPIPSPDGQFVAAFRGPDLWAYDVGDPVQARRPELWLMRADGSGARLVSLNASAAHWSSDSRRLVFDGFVAGAESTYTVAAAGGRPKHTSSNPSPDGRSSTPSPDGRSIAFFLGDSVVVRRTRHERIVARGLEGRLLWSPDSRWLAIRDHDILAVVQATGGVVNVFSAVPNRCDHDCIPPVVAWSPDSRLIAFETADGIEVAAAPSPAGARPATLLVKGRTQGFAWSPRGDAVAFVVPAGVRVARLDGHVADLVAFGPGELQSGMGWSPGHHTLHYRTPEDPALMHASGRELEAKLPIQQLSADGDRVAYWLCPHSFGAWRPGSGPVVLGHGTVAACFIPAPDLSHEFGVYNLTLAGDRLAYLTVSGVMDANWELWLTTLERGDEGVGIDAAFISSSDSLRWVPVTDLVGDGSTLVYGRRRHPSPYGPEAVWRVDGVRPVEVASRPDDLQPLAVDGGRIVARRTDGSLELLSLDGHVLETFDVPSLGAVLVGDDLVALVQGELRDYSVASGELLHAWPLPDVPSSGRCSVTRCRGIRLTLDDAARGLVVYTVDGLVHLLRLRDGADETVAVATAVELTDAGLFYAYVGAEPWLGRIRFVPFDELPLR